MNEINQGHFEKYIDTAAEKSKKDLSERHDNVLRAVKENRHSYENFENKFNEVVSVLQERGLSADAKIIQDFVLRFGVTLQSLWRKKGQKIIEDAQIIIDSAMKDGKFKGGFSSGNNNVEDTGIPIAFQFNDANGDTLGKIFDSYNGGEIIRADTSEILKHELKSDNPDVKREFIKCRLSKEAESILHKALGTSDKTGNYYDAKEIPSILNSAVKKRGFNYEQKIPSLKGCWLVVKKEYSPQHDSEVPGICGVEITVHPDKLFFASAAEEIQEREDKVKQSLS